MGDVKLSELQSEVLQQICILLYEKSYEIKNMDFKQLIEKASDLQNELSNYISNYVLEHGKIDFDTLVYSNEFDCCFEGLKIIDNKVYIFYEYREMPIEDLIIDDLVKICYTLISKYETDRRLT